ncbi:MOSC domain-containing protein [Spirosoma montaniterrae]|uniref:Oxidoreductase n=1 Tax=Spirosoma montaniterrae TaxID=1178516 RepID=A0A1P9WST0_9BACT|nr:MOSC N-terminal beta barrel domain-containing protein [Spirosoma montaniterrae]AQG78393.1 oxidoreductase [Spirosoma montaniterrae]
MQISALYLYPVKSLGGIAVNEAVVDAKGFQHDRRFMLVDPNGIFITQRSNPHMALIDVSIESDTLYVWHRHRPTDRLMLALEPDATGLPTLPVTIWDSENVSAVRVGAEADRWFTNVLGKPCHLVFMPDSTRRTIDLTYARHTDDAVSFADGYPYLLIGQASLDDLNQRLPEPIGIERFRPNIVVSGSLPFAEDSWAHFRVGELDMYGVKPCARCILTTIDPATGQKGTEPLKTLAGYRQWKHKILFGQNVLVEPNTSGLLRVGQSVTVVRQITPWLAAPSLS